MLFFQIIPPSPSPTESKRPFFASVSLLLSRTNDISFTHFLCVKLRKSCTGKNKIKAVCVVKAERKEHGPPEGGQLRWKVGEEEGVR